MLVLLALLFLPGYIVAQFASKKMIFFGMSGRRLRHQPDTPKLDQQPDHRLNFIVYPPISLGILSLIYLWATTFGLALSAAVLRIGLLMLFLLTLWLAWKKTAPPKSSNIQYSIFNIQHLLFIPIFILLAMVIQTRWAHMRELAAPAWVDSLHHALLIRVAAERGQVPLSLMPYLPVEQLAYHWGLHVLSAASMVISGNIIPVQLPEAMLWQSLVLQVLTARSCAGLATALWRHRLAGVVALAIVGLGSIMPAFYLSWGRTTLLTGMLLLPGVLLLGYRLMRHPSYANALLLTLAMSGLSLTHLPTFVFGLAWCAVVWSVAGNPKIRSGLMLTLSLGLTGLAQLPWLILLLTRARPGTGMSALHVAGNSSYNALSAGLLWAIGNDMLLALASCAALIGILRRRHITLLIVLWCGLCVLLANPVLIGLPYLSFVTNEIMVVSLFLPATLLIAGGSVIMVESMQRRWKLMRHSSILLALALLAWAAWRIPSFQAVVNANTIIASADDMEAVRWAANNTAADAHFLVNTTGWLGPVDRGSDGGWWLLPVAGRQVSTPPVLYTYAPDDKVAQIQAESAWLRKAGEADDITIASFMRTHGYTHVFATQQGVTLNSQRLRPSPLFEEIYANATVAIFRLREP